MTTEELVVLDQQSKESLKNIQKMSNMFVFNKLLLSYLLWSLFTLVHNNKYFVCSVISSFLKELRPFMSSLYKLCENVAELDILVALAQVNISFCSILFLFAFIITLLLLSITFLVQLCQ